MITAYPNPFTNSCHITSITNSKQIDVLDMYGKVITTQAGNNLISKYPEMQLKMEAYFIRVITDKGTYISKVILSR